MMKLQLAIVVALLVLLSFPFVSKAQVAFPNRGGTGTSTAPALGQVLVGCQNAIDQWVYCPQSTSTLGITSGGGFATTSIGTEFGLESIVTDVLDIFTNNDGALDDDDLSDNTTTQLAEGTNLYFTVGRVLSYLDTLTKGYFFSTTSANFWEAQQTERTADDLSNNNLADLADVGSGSLGQLLSLTSSGWVGVASTTFSGGLTYANGNVTNDLGNSISDAEVDDNLTISSSGSVTWTALTSYPTACTNQFVRAVGDTLTCAGVGTNDVSGLDISSDTNLAATWPIALSGDTIVWQGLATTSQPSSSNIVVSNGAAGLYGVATTTLTASTPLSLSQPVIKVGGSNSVLTLDTSGTWTGNAATASALAANGANCSSGSAPLGVNTSGAVESCFDVWTEGENTAAAYTPQSRALTIAGTTNQITSSAGAQDLSSNRTWTLSLPSLVHFPNAFTASYGTTTYASSTAISATTVCLSADCRSSWPSAGSSFGQAWEIDGSGNLAPTTTVDVSIPNYVRFDAANTYLRYGAPGLTLNTADYISLGTAGAPSLTLDTTNGLYVPNNQYYGAQNSAATVVSLIGIDASDNLNIGDASAPLVLRGNAFTIPVASGSLYANGSGIVTAQTGTVGTCLEWGADGTIVDAGSGLPCGAGGASAFEIATTSDIAVSHLAYFTQTGGMTTLGSVATTTLSGNSQIALSQPVSVLGASASTLSIVADSIGDTQLAFNTGQHLTTASSPTFAGLTIGSASGVVVRASGIIGTGVDGTDFTLVNAVSCTNQVMTALTAAGVGTCTSINNAFWSGTDLSVANGGTGLSTFGGSNHILYTTTADTLASEAAFTYAASSDRLTVLYASTTALSATNINVSGIAAFATLSGALDAGGATSFEIPNGTSNTVDAIGEIAFDTTDGQLLIASSTNSSWPVVYPSVQKLWGRTIASTSVDFVNGGRIPLPPLRDGARITEIHCFVDGGTSVIVNLDTLAGGANTDTITCGTTLTSDTAQSANQSYSAGALWATEIGTISGAVDYVSISVWGTWTQE